MKCNGTWPLLISLFNKFDSAAVKENSIRRKAAPIFRNAMDRKLFGVNLEKIELVGLFDMWFKPSFNAKNGSIIEIDIKRKTNQKATMRTNFFKVGIGFKAMAMQKVISKRNAGKTKRNVEEAMIAAIITPMDRLM